MARSFSASSSIYMESSVIPTIAYPFTMAAWFKPTGVHAGSTFYSLGHTVSSVWMALAYDGANAAFFEIQNAAVVDAYGAAGTPVVDNQWNLIVSVHASATSHLTYCNAVAGTLIATSIALPTCTKYAIGGLFAGGTPIGSLCRGDVDFCTYWQGAALTAAEVLRLWNGGDGGLGKHPLTVQPDFIADCFQLMGDNPERDLGAPRDGVARPMALVGVPPLAAGPPVEPLVEAVQFKPVFFGTMFRPALNAPTLPSIPGQDTVVAAGGTLWTQNIDDTITIADALVFDRGLTFADALTIADTFAFDRAAVVADTISVADNVTAGLVIAQAVNDTISIADAIAFVYGPTIADSLTVADALAISRGLALADGVSVADAIALAYGLALSDALTVSDAQVVSQGFGRSVNDTISIADSATPTLVLVQTPSDTITIVDSIAMDRGLSLADTITIADALALAYGLVLAETLTISETQAFGYGRTLTDTMSIADNVAATLVLVASVNDTLTVADAIALAVGLGLSEALTISDAQAFSRGQVIADAIAITDAQAFLRAIALADALTVADATTPSVGRNTAVNDSLSIADVLNIQQGRSVSLADTVSIFDTIPYMIWDYGRQIDDALTIADAVLREFSAARLGPAGITGWIPGERVGPNNGSRGRVQGTGTGIVSAGIRGKVSGGKP